MESAPNEVVNPPPLEPMELSASSDTIATKSNNIGPLQTLEKLLLRISKMETSIIDL